MELIDVFLSYSQSIYIGQLSVIRQILVFVLLFCPKVSGNLERRKLARRGKFCLFGHSGTFPVKQQSESDQ